MSQHKLLQVSDIAHTQWKTNEHFELRVVFLLCLWKHMRNIRYKEGNQRMLTSRCFMTVTDFLTW